MKKFVLAASLSALTHAAQAVNLAQWDTASSTTNPTITATSSDSSVAAADLSAGSGISAASGGTYNWNNWADDPGDVPNISYAEAIGENEFWTWGLTVIGSQPLALESMDIRVDRSGTGPNEFEIKASINSGAEVSVQTHDFGDGSSGVDFVGIDLTGLAQLNPGDTIEFFLAAWGADSGGTSNFGTFDLETVDFNGSDPRSIRINGSIIPEPTSALFGLLGLSLIFRRRKK